MGTMQTKQGLSEALAKHSDVLKVTGETEVAPESQNPKLAVIEQAEMWDQAGDEDFVFDSITLILRRGKDYFWTTVKERLRKSVHAWNDTEIEAFPLSFIPAKHYCPDIEDEKITVAPDPLPANTYIERPSLLRWKPSQRHSQQIASLVLREVRVHEALKEHPHPNLAQYRGCLVEDNKITGICVAQYASTLEESLEKDPSSLDMHAYYEGIKSGLNHLHRLGYAHNDINPRNIMMHGATSVIIDFDCCMRIGEALGEISYTLGWMLEGAEFATEENDLHGIRKIASLLLEIETMEQRNKLFWGNSYQHYHAKEVYVDIFEVCFKTGEHVSFDPFCH